MSAAMMMEGRNGGDTVEVEEQAGSGDVEVVVGLHPLLVDTVLDHLMECLHLSDLKNARLVCQKWNQSVLPRFRKTFTAEISSYLNPQYGMQPKVVEDFVEDMRESKEIPFTRYILADFPWKTQVADDFFWLVGRTLTEFTPWLQMNGRQWDLGDLRNLLLYHCPRLEKLYVSPAPQWFRRQKQLFPPSSSSCRDTPTLPSIKEIVINSFRSYPVEFLQDLFSATINLQKLNIRCQNEDDVKGTGEWPEVSVFGAIEYAGRERTLNTLILVDISDNLLHSLIHLSNKKEHGYLRLLKFTWVYQRDECNVSVQLLQKFLFCQRLTLEYLMLDQFTKFDRLILPHNFVFPIMPNLTTFSYGHEGSDCVEPFSLSENFPQLRTLQTGYYSDESYFSSRMNTFEMQRFWIYSAVTTNVTTFHIHKPVLAKDIALMTKMMGSVRRLKIVVYSREAMTQVWKGWQQLETLSLSHKSIKDVDSGFTGIPKEEYFRLVTENNYQEDPVSLAVEPSLRDLKHLRSLVIMDGLCSHLTTGVDIYTLLSDFTGYNAIKYLTHLKEIAIEGSMLTQQCCMKLLDELKLEAWRFTDMHSADLVPPQNIRQIERFFNEFEQERY
ncbi:Nischarin [Orchesella cincta]|uniref:Nischarin n=1 Tax=Orchesella cincta TaxID=48709 RepID=A0A1D2MIS7_ORCCI|nr:Nischarin [Orchesella cincta]